MKKYQKNVLDSFDMNRNMNTHSHNLDIHTYSLQDVFDLFDLNYRQPISVENIKRAKHKVLMTHPDKSRLPPEYFLFYKKAFEIVAKQYTDQQRQNQVMPKEPMKYCPMRDQNRRTTARISKEAEASQKEFQDKFNRLFEENMAQKVDATRNAWFSSEEPAIQSPNEKVTLATMGTAFEKMKEKQASMILYRGVEDMVSNRGLGVDLYDEEENPDQYVSCDPFSKLKYDDLRKVHKDQTVFAVSERDFQKVPQYASMDHFMKQRGAQTLTPIEKTAAEKILLEKENQKREWMMKQQYAANTRTSQYEEKNKEILSHFLHLTGGV